MALLVLLLLSLNAYGQPLYVGMKGGTPLSDSMSSATVGGRTGSGHSTLNIRRYTVGPTVEVLLPFGLRFEADALYKRLDRLDSRFLGQSFGNVTRLAANSWEFPLLLKYPVGDGRFRPFAAAGGTFRRIQSFEGSTEMFTSGFDPPYRVTSFRINEPLTQGGIVFGGGVRIGTLEPLKLTPEIRYTRWTSLRFFPTRNQVEFLLGVGF